MTTLLREQTVSEPILGVRGVLLVDEAHNMKNHESKRTKAIIDIANFSKRAIMISGTCRS